MKNLLQALSGLLCSLLMLGCNQHGQPIEDFGIEKLTRGVSTEADVRAAMGEPGTVWDEGNGARTFEYPKGPAGHRTWMITLDASGTVRDWQQVLTPENFAKIRAGMTKDEVRRLLGKPRSSVDFERKNETVWDWRYLESGSTERIFNVHFDRGSGLVTGTSVSDELMG
jgi:outer membrane protein assembly factor BamE (lipoprotein component of BamABCDE complex)